MKFACRGALFGLLVLACATAMAQRSPLVSALPPGLDAAQVLQTARGVFAARGWSVDREEANSMFADKDNSSLRLFVSDGTLYYVDRSQRERGGRGGRHGERGTQLSAVPQAELDGLRADLAAALAGRTAAPPEVAA